MEGTRCISGSSSTMEHVCNVSAFHLIATGLASRQSVEKGQGRIRHIASSPNRSRVIIDWRDLPLADLHGAWSIFSLQ
jgi:hypothetical protein